VPEEVLAGIVAHALTVLLGLRFDIELPARTPLKQQRSHRDPLPNFVFILRTNSPKILFSKQRALRFSQ
jgi:hypothetical protein